ncbi:hypothetical protein IWQ56_004170, partial [Coemansia nantahalensis]
QMAKVVDIARFRHIYLVDICRPLCEIATRRVKALGWTNVHVVCQDGTSFELPDEGTSRGGADLVTMSYSLSMLGNHHAAIDHISRLLRPATGVLGVVDFYVSESRRGAGSSEGGAAAPNYHCGWLARTFWQAWFELDHVHLHPSRRSYLEHVFETVKVVNARNHFIVPYLVQIPYYVWLGSAPAVVGRGPVDKPRAPSYSVGPPTPTASPWEGLQPRDGCPDTWSQSSAELTDDPCADLAGRPVRPAGWVRLPYQPARPEHAQFSTYIYGFTWEDPKTDIDVLDLQRGDSILAITSAGDNILAYAAHTEGLTVHCVDMNPCQNHLLELKLAALHTLDYGRFWSMFGTGRLPEFGTVLDMELSPQLSAAAYQYWRANAAAFGAAGAGSYVARALGHHNLYTTGFSGLALRCLRALTRVLGVHGALQRMVAAESVEAQAGVWRTQVLRKMLGQAAILLLDNRVAMWQLMGVPTNQWNMLRSEGSMSQYVRDTLDPVATGTSFARSNYFYRLVIAHEYSRRCCPDYLTEGGFARLRKTVADASRATFHIHTATIAETLWKMAPGELTKAIIMDHMDWFAPADAEAEVKALHHAIRPGGFVLWRSAARIPWYVANFEANGFRVEPLAVRQPNSQIALDRVNMYASFYRATKL